MRPEGFILAIDSYLIRKGMASLLNRIHGVRVIREFDAVDPLIQYTKKHGAEFLVISQSLFNRSTDLFLSEAGLLEKTILLKQGPSKKEDQEVHASIYLSEGKEEIIQKIMQLLELRSHDSGRDHSRDLTQREITIVRLVSMGLTNRQIADELFLSTHTVITHRKNISRKLGIKSVSGLTVYAIVNNIITIEEVVAKPSQ
ncbi:MAG: LuxR C-terminal-related transcriptional regulator [Bacteroidota bacterium]